jgi:hypothetical protein
VRNNRPPTALAGNAFDGLFRASLRDDYVEAGEDAAHAWLTGGPDALTRDAG